MFAVIIELDELMTNGHGDLVHIVGSSVFWVISRSADNLTADWPLAVEDEFDVPWILPMNWVFCD